MIKQWIYDGYLFVNQKDKFHFHKGMIKLSKNTVFIYEFTPHSTFKYFILSGGEILNIMIVLNWDGNRHTYHQSFVEKSISFEQQYNITKNRKLYISIMLLIQNPRKLTLQELENKIQITANRLCIIFPQKDQNLHDLRRLLT